jgi:alpha-tubulin suppressor-like RCC1 family protein
MRALLFAFVVLLGIVGCSSDSGGKISDPPPTPASVVATPGNERVVVEWSGVSNAMIYNLHWSTDANFNTENVNTVTNVSSPYTHDQLDNDEDYYYAVTAVGQGGESQFSSIAQATPVAPPGPATVTATASNQQVTIEWTSVPGALTYNLHWSTDANFSPENVTTINNVSSPYTHNQLSNDTEYFYAVTVILEDGESKLSVVSQSSPISPPSKPSQLFLTATTSDVTLQWSEVDGANGYSLYLAAEPYISKENIQTLQGWAIINNVSSPYTHTGLIPGITYYFALVASNPGGASILSNETPGMLLPEAPGVDAVTPLDKQVTVEWTDVVGAQSYNLYIASESGVTPESISSLQDSRVMTDVTSPLIIDGLVNGKDYYFVITAVNASGESFASTEGQATPKNLTPIALGSEHTCSILDDYSLWCWGYNDEGQLGIGTFGDSVSKTQPTRVGGSNNWNYVAAGQYNTCGVQTDGSLWCWGANYDGQIGDGTDGGFNRKLEPLQIAATETWSEVTIGSWHACAITESGLLKCWGNAYNGQIGNGSWSGPVTQPTTVLNSDIPWLMVSAGSYHNCAIKANNTLWCWGRGADGRLGDGFTTDRNTPTLVAGEWVKVAAGGSHTCAIRADGALRCWGKNEFGQLGNSLSGSSEVSLSPDVVNSTIRWIDITAGNHFSCGVKEDGTLWCWGQNIAGQVGQGTSGGQDTYNVPTQVGTETQWRTVSAGRAGIDYDGTTGGDHVCAYKQDGSVWCWGDNEFGQLGEGVEVDSPNQYSVVPVPVNADSNWASLSVGRAYTCAIKDDSTLWCWGDNSDGRLGINSEVDKPKPVQVGTDTWLQINAGRIHTCGIKSNRTLWCWGVNDDGQLGLGITSTIPELIPLQVGTDTDWQHVSVGIYFTCGLKVDGTIHCWGWGSSGRLAQDSTDTTDKYTPTPIIAAQVWQSLSVGRDHACALADDNSMWCWGKDTHGETGQNDFSFNLYLPTQVELDSDWKFLASGDSNTCGIKTDLDINNAPTNQLYCWGINQDDQLGNGGINSLASLPGLVSGDSTNWRSVAAHSFHSCGVKHDNTLWCWGANDHGTIGNGYDNTTYSAEPDPVQIGDADWSTVGVGSDHTCGLKLDGTIWCWGENNQGQLGNGSAWSGDPLQVRFP